MTDEPTQAASATVPARVGVLGGGRMGAGIAHAFLTSGAQVVVVERDEEAARAAYERIAGDVAASAERGKLSEDAEAVLGRLTCTVGHDAFAGCDLVVEAVFEDEGLKRASLASIAEHAPDAWLATNTSSISIDALAAALPQPERLIGLHFFNPVPASKLIEVVLGERTNPVLADLARGWSEALGKTAVVVRDTPGFASSRLGVAIALEAMRMVEEGVAEPRDIDNAMVLGYKFPVGPLELTDLVGLDVRLGIAEYLHAHLGERFAPPQILRDKVARGELGRKTGQGFYRY